MFVGRSMTKSFLSEFSASVDAYIAENDPSDFSAVIARFGEPEVIAKSFLSESNLEYVKRKLHVRKAVLVFGLLVILIWACAMTIVAIDAIHTTHEEYYVEYGPYDAGTSELNNPLVNMEP